VYLLLCGESCQEDGSSTLARERELKAEKEFIRDEFESDWLDEASRHAHEQAAIQKLGDLADYMNVFADPSLDPAFREKAGEMILKLFVSDKATLINVPGDAGRKREITVRKMLEKGRKDKLLFSEVRFDSVLVVQALHKSGDGSYRGYLACTGHTTIYTGEDTLQAAQPVLIEVHVNQAEKVFGPDTLNVWEVLLGDLRARK
jgi:hypothetical protein